MTTRPTLSPRLPFALATISVLVAVPLLTAGVLAQAEQPSRAAEMLVYFGTYTGEKSKGIDVSRLDLASGALTPPALVAETPNPSFLAIHPSGNFLYAANEVRDFDGQPGGAVSGFAIERKTGHLTALNQMSSRGAGAVSTSSLTRLAATSSLPTTEAAARPSSRSTGTGR